MKQNKIGLAHSLTSIRVEIHRYLGLCGPFNECTRHIADDNMLYFDREMMNSSNSPAQACLKLPSSLPNWAKGPLQLEMLWRESRKASQLFFPFIQLPGSRQRGKGKKAELSWFLSPLLSPQNDQQQEIIAKGSQSHIPLASLINAWVKAGKH